MLSSIKKETEKRSRDDAFHKAEEEELLLVLSSKQHTLLALRKARAWHRMTIGSVFESQTVHNLNNMEKSFEYLITANQSGFRVCFWFLYPALPTLFQSTIMM